MTNDEAKAQMKHIRTFALKNWVDLKNVHALDIALWLLERDEYVQRALYPGIPVLRDPRKQLEDWERAHPRPGS